MRLLGMAWLSVYGLTTVAVNVVASGFVGLKVWEWLTKRVFSRKGVWRN